MGNEQKLEAERRPATPNGSGLEVIKNLANEEILEARRVAERIAKSIGFNVRKD